MIFLKWFAVVEVVSIFEVIFIFVVVFIFEVVLIIEVVVVLNILWRLPKFMLYKWIHASPS